MFTERIRTIGFGLLGCGRGEEGMPTPKPLRRVLSTHDQRYNLGRADGKQVEKGKKDSRGVVRPGDEGYFELCVKSVEAVCWDPLSEDQPGYAKGFDRPFFEFDQAEMEGRESRV